MTRKLNAVLLVLLIVVGAPFYWLLLDSSTVDVEGKPVTIGQLRALAGRDRADFPREARYETLGHRWIISDLLAAGSGLRPVPFVVRAYELVYADGAKVTIDRGVNRRLAQEQSLRGFDPLAQARVDQALAAADLHLLLALRPQHSGDAELARHASAGSSAKRAAPYAAAPGIVVIPTPEIAVGSCMIYVRLESGREILFAGDIAPIHVSWEQQRPPGRLTTTFLVGDRRDQIGRWLRMIDDWRHAAPGMHIVSGHDAAVPRVVSAGFAAAPEAASLP